MSVLVLQLVLQMVNSQTLLNLVINLRDLFSYLLSATLQVHKFQVNTKPPLAMFNNCKTTKVNHIWHSSTLAIQLRHTEHLQTCIAINNMVHLLPNMSISTLFDK